MGEQGNTPSVTTGLLLYRQISDKDFLKQKNEGGACQATPFTD